MKNMETSNYEDRFAKELLEAERSVEGIKDDKRSYVKYKDARPLVNIKHMVESSCELYKDRVAFHEKFRKTKGYEKILFKDLLEMYNEFGTGLLKLGLKGKKIAIIGSNSSRWAISYLAVVCGVGVVVPIDKELPEKKIEDIVRKAEVSAIIYEDKYKEIFKKMRGKDDNCLKTLINMTKDGRDDDIMGFGEVINLGIKGLNEGDREFLDAEIDRDEMSILLFTSGTTGNPKGVMLSHKNIVEDIMAAPTILKVTVDDIFFSVLPMHHTYECTCGMLLPIYKGASVAYCEGLKYIAKNLQEVRPTMFLGVPAIFEKLYKKIWQNVRKKGKENTLKKIVKINNKTKKVGINLGKIFFKDILNVFGGRMRIMISGGAAIDPSVIDGIRDFGINVVQGYGLTECAPLAALNPDTAPVSSSIGVAFPNMELRVLDEDEKGIGELCVKGPNVMLGYYEMPEETAEAVVDGWFRTGDLGYIDENGYAYITGRRKNLIITKNGENVSPEELEYEINLSPLVLESMVYQDEAANKEDTLIAASIVVDWEYIDEFHSDIKDDDDEIIKMMWEIVDRINEAHPVYMKIRKINFKKEELLKNTTNKIIRFAEENKL